MNILVETIYWLRQEKLSLKEVLERTLEELYEKSEILKGSIELCEKVLTEGDVSKNNVDVYLDYVRSEESRGTRYAEIEEFLEEITDFMQVNKFRGDPYIGRFFRNPWVARILSVLVLVLYVLVPVIYVLETLDAGGKISGTRLLMWLVLWLVLAIGFVRYRKWRNK